jgi:glycosyltransferase involved in cell wall biosynthesis
MNIVIFNWRDIKHPLAGGAEQSLMELAKYWRKKGADVLWFSSLFPKAKQQENIDGVEIVRTGSHYTVHIFAALYFQKYLRNKTNIVIDCFHGMPYFVPLYFDNKKIIALINEPAKEVWFKNLIFPLSFIAYHLEPSFFKPYKKIPFITSASSIAVELKMLGISQKYIHIIPHGVTLEKKTKHKKEKYPTIIFLSQLSQDKGIEDALQAFALLNNPSAHLWIVGKPVSQAYLHKLKKLAKKLKLTTRITFFGFVPQAEKFKLLQKAWILIHPSVREGWGLNVIEANSYGTPAIGYNVTGLRDSIMNNRTGLLTNNNSPESLAESMKNLIINTGLRERLGRNAKKYAEGFTWDQAGSTSWELVKTVYEKSKK